jgi:hypothetical protein
MYQFQERPLTLPPLPLFLLSPLVSCRDLDNVLDNDPAYDKKFKNVKKWIKNIQCVLINWALCIDELDALFMDRHRRRSGPKSVWGGRLF